MKQRFTGRSLPIVVVAVVSLLLLQVSVAMGVTERTVTIKAFKFDPATARIEEGGMVTWKNEDNVAHTVASDEGGFETEVIAPGATSEALTFLKAGRYPYHCSIVPGMTGTIVVEAAAAGSPGASPSFPSTDTLLGPTGRSGNGSTGTTLIAMLLLAGAAGWWAVRGNRSLQPAFASAGIGGTRSTRRGRELRPVSDLSPHRNITLLRSLYDAGGWASVEQAFRLTNADPASIQAVREFLAEQEDWHAWEPKRRRRPLRRSRRVH